MSIVTVQSKKTNREDGCLQRMEYFHSSATEAEIADGKTESFICAVTRTRLCPGDSWGVAKIDFVQHEWKDDTRFRELRHALHLVEQTILAWRYADEGTDSDEWRVPTFIEITKGQEVEVGDWIYLTSSHRSYNDARPASRFKVARVTACLAHTEDGQTWPRSICQVSWRRRGPHVRNTYRSDRAFRFA